MIDHEGDAHSRARESSAPEDTDRLPRTIGEYADRYLRDLLDRLPEDDARVITQTLAMSYMGGPFPDRESVQRLIEHHCGAITDQQYHAWVLTFASRHAASNGEAIGHILDSLAAGFEVGGSRERALWLLAGMDDTRRLLARVRDAVDHDVLTDAEARDVLTQALKYPPLPAPVPLPEGVDRLPQDWPPSTRRTTGPSRSHRERVCADSRPPRPGAPSPRSASASPKATLTPRPAHG